MKKMFLLLASAGICGATPIIPLTPYMFPAIQIIGSASYQELPAEFNYEPWMASLSLSSLLPGALDGEDQTGAGSHPCCYPGPQILQNWGDSENNGWSFAANDPAIAPLLVTCNLGSCDNGNGYNGYSFNFTPEANGTFTGTMIFSEMGVGNIAIIPVYGDFTYTTSGVQGSGDFSATYAFVTPEPSAIWLATTGMMLLLLLGKRVRVKSRVLPATCQTNPGAISPRMMARVLLMPRTR